MSCFELVFLKFIAEYYNNQTVITLDDGKKITVLVTLKSKEQL